MLLKKVAVHSFCVRSRAKGLQKSKHGDHFGCSMLLPSVPFFFIIEYSALVVLQFNYKGMLVC